MKLLSASFILIFINFKSLNGLAQIKKSKSFPFELLIHPTVNLFELFIDDFSLFVFEVKTNLTAPFDCVTIDAHIIEIFV